MRWTDRVSDPNPANTWDPNLTFNNWARVTGGAFGTIYNEYGNGGSLYGRGLYSYGRSGDYYSADRYGQWYYQAPPEARIFRADWGYLRHDPVNSKAYFGIWSATQRWWESMCVGEPYQPCYRYNDPVLTTGPLANKSYTGCQSTQGCVWGTASSPVGTPGNLVVVGLGMRSNAVIYGAPILFMGGAQVGMHEFIPPGITTFSRSNPLSGWVSSGTDNVTVNASDGGGLGLKRLVLERAESGALLHQSVSSCTGKHAYASPCPASFPSPATLSYNTASLPEGISTMQVRGADVVDNVSAPRKWTVKVDRTAPRLTGFPGRVRQDAAVGSGLFDLTIEAEDVGANGAENAGVARFEYKVGAGSWVAATKSCTSGPCSHTFELDTRPESGLAEGRHQVTVRATDGVGLQDEDTFSIVVDRTAPRLNVEGELKDMAGQQLTAGVWSLGAEAQDISPSVETSGVSTIRMFVDGEPFRSEGEDASTAEEECEAGDPGCPLEMEIAYSTAEYPEGGHEILVRATDYAGNQTEERVPLNSGRDQPPCSGKPLEVFNLGRILEGLPMIDATRECTAPDPDFPELGREDSIAYVYGGCPPLEGSGDEEVEGGCEPQLQIQVTTLCMKHAKLYHAPEIGQVPYEELTILGVPAASMEGGEILEIYTGNTTITIFGLDPAQVRRAAEQLRPALTEDIPVVGQVLTDLSEAAASVAPLTSLPQPNLSVLNETEACA